MPRARKPPMREGSPGRYANRTDLAMEGATQPVRTPTGQPYGRAGDLAQSQQAEPLPQPPDAPPAAPQSPQRVPGTLTPMEAQDYRLPQLGLNGPTSRPTEPITSGVNVGVGRNAPRYQNGRAGALFAALAESTGDPLMRELAEIADAQGF